MLARKRACAQAHVAPAPAASMAASTAGGTVRHLPHSSHCTQDCRSSCVCLRTCSEYELHHKPHLCPKIACAATTSYAGFKAWQRSQATPHTQRHSQVRDAGMLRNARRQGRFQQLRAPTASHYAAALALPHVTVFLSATLLCYYLEPKPWPLTLITIEVPVRRSQGRARQARRRARPGGPG